MAIVLESKAQLQTFLNEATPVTKFQSTEDMMLPYFENHKFVTDIQGRFVVSFALTGSQGQQVWDTRQVEKGVYVYTLKAGTVSKQGKLVIQ